MASMFGRVLVSEFIDGVINMLLIHHTVYCDNREVHPYNEDRSSI